MPKKLHRRFLITLSLVVPEEEGVTTAEVREWFRKHSEHQKLREGHEVISKTMQPIPMDIKVTAVREVAS